MNKKSDLEKSSSSLFSELSGKSEKSQKYYYLYKVGGKYFLRKKGKKNLKDKSLTNKQSTGKINSKSIESHINFLFKYKYNKACQYNTIIINRLIYNINSLVVTKFKENLILFDENEFIFRFYEINNAKKLLKKILNYYELNNVIYPNYTSIYEGNYLFNNIEQKQKIIDRQEKISKNKKDKDIKSDDNNKEEDILNSNVVESILNQTNTSETKRFFGLNNDSNYIEEDDDFSKIYSLIKNIEKFDKKENSNKIFKKKSLIRIINDKEKSVKKENSIKKENIKINKNIYQKDLLSTVSYFKKFKSKFIIKDDTTKDNSINNKQYFSNTFYNNNLKINKKNNNSSSIHKRINTFDTHKIRSKYFIFTNNSINFSNNTSRNFKNPYSISKRPIINKENITYSKKKIYQNFSRRNKNITHKISKSINTVSNSNFNLDNDYFNL